MCARRAKLSARSFAFVIAFILQSLTWNNNKSSTLADKTHLSVKFSHHLLRLVLALHTINFVALLSVIELSSFSLSIMKTTFFRCFLSMPNFDSDDIATKIKVCANNPSHMEENLNRIS